MIVYYRNSYAQWGKEYYIKEWCCDKFKEDTEGYDIEIDDDVVIFSTCEDEGTRHIPFRFKFCPCCGKKIKIKKGEPYKTTI